MVQLSSVEQAVEQFMQCLVIEKALREAKHRAFFKSPELRVSLVFSVRVDGWLILPCSSQSNLRLRIVAGLLSSNVTSYGKEFANAMVVSVSLL